MSDYLPSVRGDALLLTHGRTGAAEDALLIAAAVVIDGVLGGQLHVTGGRRLALGPVATGAPLLLELCALRTAGNSPWDWFESAAAFALQRASGELIAAGVAERALPDPLARLFRHDTLRVHPEHEAAARNRLADVLTGRPAPPYAIALAGALHGCGRLEEVAGVCVTRCQLQTLTDAVRSLGCGTQAVLATLRERRRSEDMIAA
jgi:hypothetical protein